MLGNNKPIAFLATANAVAAKDFYKNQLGLIFIDEDNFAIVFNLHEVELRIQKLEQVVPQPQTALGWSVNSIENTVQGLISSGISFERFDGMRQDELGIWSSPSGAKIAWFKDPDGNILSLTEQ